MKNFTKISIVLILVLATSGLKAQSYGYYYSGNTYVGQRFVPHAVVSVVNLYHGFEWVGTSQFQRGHRQLFIVTLRRGNRFVELTINKHGEVISRNRYVRDFAIQTYPYRRGTERIILYHDPGYVYSRTEDRRHVGYNWSDSNDWNNWKDNKKEKKWDQHVNDNRGHPRKWN